MTSGEAGGRGSGAEPEPGRASSRAALIAAALDEFSEKGYESATVAGIAERAGVTTGALYAHFNGKLDLLIESIGMKSVDSFVRTINAAAARPWSEAVEVLAQRLSRPPDRRSPLMLDAIVVARRDPAVAATLRSGLDRFIGATAAAARAGVAAGTLDPALEADDLARLFLTISFGLLVLAGLDEAPPSDEAIVRVTDLLLQSHGEPAGRPADPRPVPLARVRSRAVAVDEAQRQLEQSIRAAAEEGHSLRRIGDAAGLSHEQVRRILAKRHVS
jgi:AcrR family transcriptional regulator